jgi:hypothetical protein
MNEHAQDYEETIEILDDKRLSKDLKIGIQQIKENKLVDWSELEKGLSIFTPEFMEDGRNQPAMHKKES